jgi:hypothetical protein
MPRLSGVEVKLGLDAETIQWVETQFKKRALDKTLGGSIPSAEDKLILQIHEAVSQPIFDKALAARGTP